MAATSSQYAKLEGQDVKASQFDDYPPEPRRRNYEICMVFKCKTSKSVKFHDADGVADSDMTGFSGALHEALPQAQKQMELWKQRREAILKSLQNCGLRLFCYYSRDRDEIIVKIGAPPQKLRDTAARMKYKLQLKKQYLNAYAEYRHDFPGRPERGHKDQRIVSHIYKTHTEDDYPDSDAIFRTLDKINLIHHMITSKDKDCAGISIGDYLLRGDLKAYFPLHESSALSDLRINTDLRWFLMPEEFATKFHDYFGDRISFYFLFMSFYWKWLLPIAAVGLGLQAIDLLVNTPDNLTSIPFCILMSVWSVFLPYFWRRQEAKYSVGWGSLDMMPSLAKPRPEHYGEPRMNPVTSQVEPHFSFKQRLKWYALSATTMAFSAVVSIFLILVLMVFRHNINKSYSALWLFQIGMAIFVELSNTALSKLAVKLTELENHRTQQDHETHMLSKAMVLKFICSYCVLYYTAFFKHHHYLFGNPMMCYKDDCLLDLEWQLGIFVIFRTFVSNTVEYIAPKVKLWWNTLFFDSRQGVNNSGQSMNTVLHSMLAGHSSLELADMSAAEQQAKKDEFDSFSNFDDALITHGFTTFFAVAAPWVTAMSVIGCLIEMSIDMKSLFDFRQRPLPYRARSNEPWSTAFDVYGVLAASTNILLLIFATRQYETWTFTEKLVLFIYLEHMVLLARLLLKVIFPPVPRNVELLALKQDNMVHRCLENIKVEHNQDFSHFRDHHNSHIQVFDQDIQDSEEDKRGVDDKEPEFDFSGSMNTLMTGLKSEFARTFHIKI